MDWDQARKAFVRDWMGAERDDARALAAMLPGLVMVTEVPAFVAEVLGGMDEALWEANRELYAVYRARAGDALEPRPILDSLGHVAPWIGHAMSGGLVAHAGSKRLSGTAIPVRLRALLEGQGPQGRGNARLG